MAIYTTRDGDMLDDICYRHYGQSAGMVEAVLEVNPGLADQGPVFASGITMTLPTLRPAAVSSPLRLWN